MYIGHSYISVNTHVHADHVTGTGEIKKALPNCKSGIAKCSKAVADIEIEDGDVVKFGPFQVECRSTPGHTDGMHMLSMTFSPCQNKDRSQDTRTYNTCIYVVGNLGISTICTLC